MSDLIYDNEITDNGSPSLEKDSRYLTISVFEDKLVKRNTIARTGVTAQKCSLPVVQHKS